MSTAEYNSQEQITEVAEKKWHAVFEFGILLKTINGTLELISGSLILFISKNAVNSLFTRISRAEVLEDPNDRVMLFLANGLRHITTDGKNFAVIYILLHGVLNLFLAYFLYKERLWAYIVSMTTMSLFICYQLFRITHHFSPFLALLTIWDVIFITVTWHEYKYKKQHYSSKLGV